MWKPLWSDLQGAQIRDQRFSICSQTRKETSAASAGVRACILENKSLKADPAAAHPGVEARQRAMVGAPPRLAAPPMGPDAPQDPNSAPRTAPRQTHHSSTHGAPARHAASRAALRHAPQQAPSPSCVLL